MAKNSVKTKPLSVKIAEPQQRLAWKAIDAMILGYQPIAAKLVKIAEPLFKLACLASQLGKGVPEYTAAYFKEICKQAETHAKEANGVDNLKDLLPCWAVFKSEINRAIEAKLVPGEFDSYSALKAARVEHDRAEEQRKVDEQTSRQSAAMKDGVRTGSGGTGTEGLGAAATSTKVTAKMGAVLTVMQGAIGGMDEDTQDAFAEELATLIAKYAPAQPKQERKARKAKVETETEHPTEGAAVAA